jgi:hypothetical protein
MTAIWVRVVMLILIRITIWKLLTSVRCSRKQSLGTTCSWSRRYGHIPMGCLACSFSFV